MLKDCPSLVKRSTFVDPVVFCLWEGDVCHSFCYRQPATVSLLSLLMVVADETGFRIIVVLLYRKRSRNRELHSEGKSPSESEADRVAF